MSSSVSWSALRFASRRDRMSDVADGIREKAAAMAQKENDNDKEELPSPPQDGSGRWSCTIDLVDMSHASYFCSIPQFWFCSLYAGNIFSWLCV